MCMCTWTCGQKAMKRGRVFPSSYEQSELMTVSDGDDRTAGWGSCVGITTYTPNCLADVVYRASYPICCAGHVRWGACGGACGEVRTKQAKPQLEASVAFCNSVACSNGMGHTLAIADPGTLAGQTPMADKPSPPSPFKLTASDIAFPR